MNIRNDRKQLHFKRPLTVWLTGLSASGKSTIAFAFNKRLIESNFMSYVLDGDVLRAGLNRDLGFSHQDRRENVRRVAEVSRMFNEAGAIVIVALISPYIDDRKSARMIIGADRFVEVYVDAPVHVCEQRDPKGLYKKARAGLVSEFTGISAVYEEPQYPDIRLRTVDENVNVSVGHLWNFFQMTGQ